jgi:DNA repair protein RadC
MSLYQTQKVNKMITARETIDDLILKEAKEIIIGRMRRPGGMIRDIDTVAQYLQMEYGLLENEQFGCMFMDQNYALINHKKLFRGTISECATYPREIAREALLQNATYVVLVHNHPAYDRRPSQTDVDMTLQIKEILAVLNIVLFDHIIVAGPLFTSMRASGHLL